MASALVGSLAPACGWSFQPINKRQAEGIRSQVKSQRDSLAPRIPPCPPSRLTGSQRRPRALNCLSTLASHIEPENSAAPAGAVGYRLNDVLGDPIAATHLPMDRRCSEQEYRSAAGRRTGWRGGGWCG